MTGPSDAAADPAPGASRGLADRLIEAGWLTALVAIPTVFNGLTARGFEPDKGAVLRTIALVMLAAWLFKWLGRKARDARGPVTETAGDPALVRRVIWTAAALLLWQVIGTVFSVDPLLSATGSYERARGLVTIAAWFVVFVALATVLTRPRQAERVVLAILLASCPIAVYGLIQHAGLDPVAWGAQTARPVTSTMGNALFLAGYLVLVAPLTLARLLAAKRVLSEPAPDRPSRWLGGALALSLLAMVVFWSRSLAVGGIVCVGVAGLWTAQGWAGGRGAVAGLRVGVLSVLLALQLAALLLTLSRGPFLGLLGAAFIFALLLALLHGRWRLLLGVLGLAAAGAAALLAISVPGSPLEGVRELPVVGRLTSVLETSGTGRVRLLLWQQTADTLGANPGRAVVGWGPETNRLALGPHYLPQLGTVEARDAQTDRAHNDSFDRILESGLVGLVLWYGLFVGLFAAGLRRLGALRGRADCLALAISCGGGSLLLLGVAVLLDGGGRLAGLALPGGLLAGLVAYLCLLGYRRRRETATTATTGPGPDALLVAALLAGLAGHFLETQFGIATVSSRLYFWACAGLLLALCRRNWERAEAPAAWRSGPEPDGRRDRLAGVALFALTIATTCYGFLTSAVSPGADPPFAWLLVISFVLAGLLLFVWLPAPGGRRNRLELLALLLFATLAALLLPQLLYAVPLPAAWSRPAAQTWFFGVLLALLGTLALALRPAAAARPPPGWRLALVPVLLVVVLAAIVQTSLRPLQADAAFKRGLYLISSEGELEEAAGFLRRSRTLAPWEPHYAVYLARAVGDLARNTQEEPRRDALYDEAARALRGAVALRPGDYELALNLARLYTRWGARTTDPTARDQRAESALAAFEQAAALSPGRPAIWNAWGTALGLQGRHGEATPLFEHSLALDPRLPDSYVLLAGNYAGLGDAEAARAVVERGIADAEPSAELHHMLGLLVQSTGRDPTPHYERALELEPGHGASHVRLLERSLAAKDCETGRLRLSAMARARPEDPVVDQARATVARICGPAPRDP